MIKTALLFFVTFQLTLANFSKKTSIELTSIFSDHIVGELMKSFFYDRALSNEDKQKLKVASPEIGKYLSEKLQPALRSISLSAHSALNTAISNDIDPELIFAQQVIGYGDQGDTLLGISTSGNSKNVISAIITAKAMGLKTIGLTGKKGGELRQICDVAICVNADETPDIQELHLPIYHTPVSYTHLTLPTILLV